MPTSRSVLLICLILTSAAVPARAFASHPAGNGLSKQLTDLRERVMGLERDLIESLKVQKQTKKNIEKIRSLMRLQQQERELGRRRLTELEKTVRELESRRTVLNEKIATHRLSIRKSLRDIHRSIREQPKGIHLPENERINAPRRKVLANLVDRELKEIEALKVDLADAEQLELRIQEERQQLTYLFQDLNEQEGVLELNRQLQVDILKQKHAERVAQLESYRKLKDAETRVEKLISNFNARKELERSVETERQVNRAFARGTFAQLKGKLPPPVAGKVISTFGKSFDSSSNLYVFKKGIDIETVPNAPVMAVSAGKIAYSGELPNYGRVTIIDHGEQFYSLCAHLGELHKKVGDLVAAGDAIGLTDDSGTPLYFEIRSRNVAVNPLQWISN